MPTHIQLAELASRLVPHDGETNDQLARRALDIWKAAGKLLAENPNEAKVIFSFSEVASLGLLPSKREKTEHLESDKGVEKAVRKFFDDVLAGYDRAMKGRAVNDSVVRENRQIIKKICDEVLAQRALSANLLNQVHQYQDQCRNKTFTVTVDLIRELLGGADLGKPMSDV